MRASRDEWKARAALDMLEAGARDGSNLLALSVEAARERLISKFDWDTTKPEWALGYRFDIVLRGSEATPAQLPGRP